MTTDPPTRQHAVQLTGSEQLVFTREKPVGTPSPHEILCRIRVVGLCFSDIKLLKQFGGHVRKSAVIAGVEPGVLEEASSYVPNDDATVPGHEVVVDVVEAGARVTRFKPGDRLLVQADWRWLKTDQSNGAFGYNFEGGLQEYVVLDERIVVSPEGESMLLPVGERLAASAAALVEPFACVEASYVVTERNTLKKDGRLLVVAGHPEASDAVTRLLAAHPAPAAVTWIGDSPPDDAAITEAADIKALADQSFDDILFFGANKTDLEIAFRKIAAGGLVTIVQCGRTFGEPVVTPVGRLHYGNVRIAGTTGADPQAAFDQVPATGELREGDRIHIVGAGGPMGTIHIIRDLSSGVPGIEIVGSDLDEERLAAVHALGNELAAVSGVPFTTRKPTDPSAGPYDYVALMVPVPALIEEGIATCNPRGIINIFAGIPATVDHPVDLDTCIERAIYFIGTSGSGIEEMKIVLSKVEGNSLNTNLVVAAVSGLDGAVDGIEAVKNAAIPGKILVYPSCHGLPLTPLDQLHRSLPDVHARIEDGVWTREAEAALLAAYAESERS